jgi:hypothetical protein
VSYVIANVLYFSINFANAVSKVLTYDLFLPVRLFDELARVFAKQFLLFYESINFKNGNFYEKLLDAAHIRFTIAVHELLLTLRYLIIT